MKSLNLCAIVLIALLPLATLQAADLVLSVNSSADFEDANLGDGICQTATPGQCTLRAAIQEAVASVNFGGNGIDSTDIVFDIAAADPGHVSGSSGGTAYQYWRLDVVSPLPLIGAADIRILGDSQPGSSDLGNPLILLRGSGTASTRGTGGLNVRGSRTTIRGLGLQGFGRAIAVTNGSAGTEATNIRIERNWVGVPLPQAETGAGNLAGIVVAPEGGSTVSRVTIGGSSAGDGNHVAGNPEGGIVIFGAVSNTVTQTNIHGNMIGIDPLTGAALGNGGAGVFVRRASTTVIGGLTLVRRNVIANTLPGSVFILGESIALPGVGVHWDLLGGGSMLGNLVGTHPAGTTAMPNAGDGVSILRSAGTVQIGAAAAGSGNLISGNGGHGIAILGAATAAPASIVIEGNRIGTNGDGSAVLANSGSGIHALNAVALASLRIGSLTAGNVIAGNQGDGIRWQASSVAGMQVIGNRIGLGANGSTPIPNAGWGLAFTSINLSGDAGSPVLAIEDNTVASNGLGGLLLSSPQLTDDTHPEFRLCGNRIGTALDGVTARGNLGPGIRLQNASIATQGARFLQDPDCTEPDLIAYNQNAGIVMAANAVNISGRFAGMRFRDNDLGEHGLAIDLGDDGPTANDPNDSDNGPNRLQNFPELGAVVLSGDGSELSVTYRVTSFNVAHYPMRIDFYLDDGNGQGIDPIGHVEYQAADAMNLVTVTLAAESSFEGRGLVALATAVDQRSSEFSRPRVVIGTTPMHSLLINRGGAGSGTVILNPPDSDCALPCLTAYPANTQVDLTANPASGSVFDFWTGACMGNVPTCPLTMSADRVVEARFAIAPTSQTLTVTLDGDGDVVSNPVGIDCPGTCQANFDHGSTVTLTASPASGWLFDEWQNCPSGSDDPVCTLTLTSAASVTAVFIQPPTEILVDVIGAGTGSVASAPSGIACVTGGGECTGSFDASLGPITLTATPDSGSVFFGWSGDCGGSGTCVLGPSGEFLATARFEPEGTPLDDEIFADGFELNP